jgi:hypothetical protein
MKNVIKLFGIGAIVLLFIGTIQPLVTADVRINPHLTTTQPTTQQTVDPNERIRQIQRELEILRAQLSDYSQMLHDLLQKYETQSGTLDEDQLIDLLSQIATLDNIIDHIITDIATLENELEDLVGSNDIPPTTPSEPEIPHEWDLV